MIELGLKGGLASMVVEEARGEGELGGDTASVTGRRRVTGRAGNLPGVCVKWLWEEERIKEE
jgi:hypothetical protein